jgi:hypothetical protein
MSLFLVIIISLFAQKLTLKGIVKKQSIKFLEGAKVYLKSINDYIPVAYRITNNNGEFSKRVNTEINPKAIFNIK